MNQARRLYTGLMFAVFVGTAVYPAAVQSQNSQALAWLKNGLTEKDPQKKIAAYRKAIELDSLFVEAKFNEYRNAQA
ncbi:hypothetical protein L0337_37275 [candidate division KSB1 bacterium]|nr:hypothetical protein [candidate division KSB1 bacterium]